jgi:hypothetical protein
MALGFSHSTRTKRVSSGEAPRLPAGNPELLATPQEGVTAAYSTPVVYGTPPITTTYEQQKDNTPIAAAPGVDPTSADFAVPTGASYAGHTLRRKTTFSNLYGSLTVFSAAVAILAAGGAPAPAPAPSPSPSTYGAAVDAGEIDDPTIKATTYDGSTLYLEGDWVKDAGGTVFSYCRKDCQGVATTDTTYWFTVNRFFYIDKTAGNDANTGSLNPATARANPLQTMPRIADYLDTSGTTYQSSDNDAFFIKRGDVHDGTITLKHKSFIGAWGSTSAARWELRFDNNTARYFTANVIDCQTESAGSVIRNGKCNIRFAVVYTYTGANTLVDGDVVSLSNGTKVATVRGTAQNNRIQVVHSIHNEFYSNSDVLQTAGAAKTLTLSSSANKSIGSGISIGAQNVAISNMEVFDGSGNGVGMGVTGTRSSANGCSLKNCIVHDTCKWGGNGAGVQGGWGSGISMQHITAYDNGTALGSGSHNYYLDDMDNADIGYLWGYSTTQLGNHGIVCHGECTNVDLHDSFFDSNRNGIGINDGYGGAWYEAFTNWRVFRNVVANCGIFGNGPGLIFDLNCMVSSKVFNNVAYGNGYIIHLRDRSTGTNAQMNGLVFAFNTIVSTNTTGDYLIKVNCPGALAITLRNNIFQSNGATLVTVYRHPSLPATECNLDNNLIYNTTGRSNVIDWGGTQYSCASFSGATNGNATNIQSAPLFTDEGGNDYTLQSGSPAKSGLVGVAISGITTDKAGTTRDAVKPGMGAFA